MSHERGAMSHEPLTINNRLINKLFDCILYVLCIEHFPRIPIPTPARRPPPCIQEYRFPPLFGYRIRTANSRSEASKNNHARVLEGAKTNRSGLEPGVFHAPGYTLNYRLMQLINRKSQKRDKRMFDFVCDV